MYSLSDRKQLQHLRDMRGASRIQVVQLLDLQEIRNRANKQKSVSWAKNIPKIQSAPARKRDEPTSKSGACQRGASPAPQFAAGLKIRGHPPRKRAAVQPDHPRPMSGWLPNLPPTRAAARFPHCGATKKQRASHAATAPARL